jgi:hypothetical protein
MKIIKFGLAVLAGMATGCTSLPSGLQTAMSDLPNCLDSNYDGERRLFTMKGAAANSVNQQCLLAIAPRGDVSPGSALPEGSYTVYLANGGGGGAGGTMPGVAGGFASGGGGGGGGAGAKETQVTVNLTEGLYKLTIGAGGPGGSVCMPSAGFGGGPGWLGSPSNMVRVATGEIIAGTPGADTYVRPTRSQNERGTKRDGNGGTGPGQASGGDGGHTSAAGTGNKAAETGDRTARPQLSGTGGGGGFMPGNINRRGDVGGGGGGGGASSQGDGGGGGGQTPDRGELAPVRGSLGAGGGGGGGDAFGCDPGAQGGHGFIALRPN